MKAQDLTGKLFGSWEAIEISPARGKYGEVFWICKCQCGVEKRVSANTLRNGTSTKCHSCSNKLHGMEGTPTYETWAGMKQRCSNPKARFFADYGGRGIKVCDEWQSFENFFADMGERPKGMSIDRIDVNKGYFKENCRWATQKQQIRNRRITRKHEWDGGMYALGDLADMHGLHVRRVQQRLNAGWSLADALTKPVEKRRNKSCLDSKLM